MGDVRDWIRKKFEAYAGGDGEKQHFSDFYRTASDDDLQMMHDAHPTNVHINQEMIRRGMVKKK